jgi:hypothetical protein
VQFVENYKVAKKCKFRSQVIALALDLLLRFQELEEAYPEASTEINQDWELTIRYER